MNQRTLRGINEFSGTGLHTGAHVNVRLLPAKEDTGICFVRKDLSGSPVIKAASKNVVATNYATTLGGPKGAMVATVEHLLAAFYGLGVDNAIVELDGPEVPVMDGSAADFVSMIEVNGLKQQDSPRKYLHVRKPIKVTDGDKYAYLLPLNDDNGERQAQDFTIDYTIDLSHPYIDKQDFSMLFSKEAFREEVVSARTFGFLRDVEMLRENGLARGGSLDNAVVIGETDILNDDGLRYPDEFVRHKVLDVLGDLSLLGVPVIGRLKANRSGHSLNHKLVQKVLRSPRRWEIIGLGDADYQSTVPVYAEELATA